MVSVGDSLMRYTTGFRAEQKRTTTWDEEAGGAVENVTWVLTLEEMIPRGAEEPDEPGEPFVLTVLRGAVQERYGDCHWTAHSRQDTQEGLRKVRTALAQTRTVERTA